MAEQKKPPTKAPAEPVNAEQAAAAEAQAAAAAPAGPTEGELEERTVEAELRADAAEAKVATLEGELGDLKRQVDALMRAQSASRAAQTPDPPEGGFGPGEEPIFDEAQPYGLVVGDDKAAYVQNGHQFDRARQYLATEKHRGVPRAFNPRLVGYTKPRGEGVRVDPLEGFRQQ